MSENEQKLPWDRPGWQQPSGSAAGTDESWEAAIRAEADEEDCYAPEVVEIALGAVGSDDNLNGLQKEAGYELELNYPHTNEEEVEEYEDLLRQLQCLLLGAANRLPDDY